MLSFKQFVVEADTCPILTSEHMKAFNNIYNYQNVNESY